MTTEYAVICGYVTTKPNGDFSMNYAWNGERFKTRKAAIKHGFMLQDSDDFNIGVLEDGKLVSLDWMDEPVDTDPELLAKIQENDW